VSNTTQNGDIAFFLLSDGTSHSWEFLRFDASANLTVFNEAGSDIDFRVESDGNANAFTIDAGFFTGVGAIAFGTTINAANSLYFNVSNPAFTAVANQSTFAVAINPGTITVPAGTAPYAASLWVEVPSLTATGTITDAATVLINNVPTAGGTGNYGLLARMTGTTGTIARFENTTNTASAAHSILDVAVGGTTSTGDPQLRLTIPGGTSWYMGVDNSSLGDGLWISTGTTVGSSSGPTIASGASNVWPALTINSGNLAYTGNTGVTTLQTFFSFGPGIISGDTPTVTVTKATSIHTVGPPASTNAAITDSSAIRIGIPGAGAVTNYHGIYIEDMTYGSTADYGITIEGADTAAIWVSSAVDTTDAANGIAFGASRDTNLYRSAANTLKTDDALSVNAQHILALSGEVAFNETSADIDFRIESDTQANAFLLNAEDASNNTFTFTPFHSGLNGASNPGGIYVDNILQYSGATNTGIARGIQVNTTLSLGSNEVQAAVGIRGFESTWTGHGGSGSNVTGYAGFYAANGTTSGAVRLNNYGIYVENQTAGTTADYGIYVAGADTYALWVDAGTSRFDGAIAFGDETVDIGTTTVGLNDLHFGSGGIINFDGGDVTLTHASNALTIAGGDTFVADGNGMVIGHTAQLAFDTITVETQILGTGNEDSRLALLRGSADDNGPLIVFAKSRDAIGTFTTDLSVDDDLGGLIFIGSDGTDADLGGDWARIVAEVDAAAAGSNDHPARLVFATAADGANSSTERMRITSAGNVGIGTTGPQGILHVASSSTIDDLILNQAATPNLVTNPSFEVDTTGWTFQATGGAAGSFARDTT
ncbi:hypothetical protein HY413_03685, partial [Candidatus Kaiserbacteria bacterium]|nr:hypothetical protein [Candidatus Kaiserbacteria bacterium]